MNEHLHRRVAPETAKAIGRPPEVRVVSVVEVAFRRGEGCCEEDPVRIVCAYFTPEGELLAENDPAPFSPAPSQESR